MSDWPQNDGEMAGRIRRHDWASTSLGPVRGWPQSLRTAVDMILDMPGPATILWGPADVQLYNDAYVAIAQDRHPELLGKPVKEGWPDAYEAAIRPLLHAARAGRATRLTGYTVKLIGSLGDMEDRAFDTDWSPLRDETGAVAGALQTLVEVTERHRADAVLRESQVRQAFLLKLSDVLRPLGDPVEIQQAAMCALGSHLSVSRAFYGDAEDDGDTLLIGPGYCHGTFPLDRQVRFSEFEQEMAAWYADGRTYVIRDTQRDARFGEDTRAGFAAIAVGAAVGVPLVKDGRVRAIVSLHQTVPRDWTNVEIALVEEVSERTWAAVERARAEAALRHSEDRQAFLLELADTLRGTGDPVRIQEDAVMMLGRRLGVDRAVYAEFLTEGSRRYLVIEHEYRTSRTQSLIGRHDLDQFGKDGSELEVGRIVAVDDTEEEDVSEEQRAVWRSLGVRARLGIPLLMAGRAVIGLGVHSAEPRHWTNDDISLVRDVGERAWDAIQRARAEAAMRASEQRFRALVTAAAYSVYRISPDWRLMYQLDSRTLAKTAEPIEDWIEKYIPAEDLPAVRREIAKAISTKSLFELEHRVHLADGGIGWVLSRAVPLLGPHGEITEWFGAGSDVTGRRTAAERLQEREADLARVQRIGRVGGLDIDITRGMRSWRSPEYRRLHGLSESQAEETHADWLGRIHADDRDQAERALFAALEGDAPSYAGEYRIIRPSDGEVRWIEARADIERDADGKARRLIGAHVDVTEQKRVQEALRESQERLAAMFEIVPVGIGVFDERGRIVLANPELRRFLPNTQMPSEDKERGWRWQAWSPDGRTIEPRDFPGARALRGETTVPGLEMLYRDDDDREIWTTVASTPVRDEHGRIMGQVAVINDVDALKRNAAALRQSEERLRQFGEASQDILWIRDCETLQWEYLTPAFEPIYGITREEALAGDNYRSWLHLIVPEDRHHAIESIRRVRLGEHVTFEYRVIRPIDGAIRWLRNTDFPIRDADGRVSLIGGVGHDITEIKLAQERLAQNEERLRSAAEVGRLGLWNWEIPTGEIHWSDEHFRMEGYGVGEVVPSYDVWASRIHPDDRDATEAALRRAMDEQEEYVREFRVVHPDGSVHWLNARGRFSYDTEGRPIRMVGAMIDATERREWEERQKVLVAELQHRTRNLMGVVRSMADKTVRSSTDLADFRARFSDRLDALSRVQSLLSRLGDYDRVTFDELIRTELAAMNGSAERVTLDGPAGVRLRSSTVQTLAMAMHELATNAVKYGALRRSTGQLAISWTVERSGAGDKPWLHIDWKEAGVDMPPPGSPPQGTGQGRELIEKALPYQLSARTSYILEPDGVHCTIAIPVSASGVANDK